MKPLRFQFVLIEHVVLKFTLMITQFLAKNIAPILIISRIYVHVFGNSILKPQGMKNL